MADKIQVQLPTKADQEETNGSVRTLLNGVLGDGYEEGGATLLSEISAVKEQVSVNGPGTLLSYTTQIQGLVNDIYTRVGDITSGPSLDYFLKEIYSRIIEPDGQPTLYTLVGLIDTNTVGLGGALSRLTEVVETVNTGINDLVAHLQSVPSKVDEITIGTAYDQRIYGCVTDNTTTVLDVAKENKATLAEVKAAVAPTIDGKTITVKEVFSDQWAAIQQFIQPTYDAVTTINMNVGTVKSDITALTAKVDALTAKVDALAELVSGTIAAQRAAIGKLNPDESSVADVINALQMNAGTTAASALDPDESSVADVVNALKTDVNVSTEE